MQAYIQRLGLVQEYHDKDIKLLLDAVEKHYLWKETNYLFIETELDSKAVFHRELKKPIFTLEEELHLVMKEWNEIMAFGLGGRHL